MSPREQALDKALRYVLDHSHESLFKREREMAEAALALPSEPDANEEWPDRKALVTAPAHTPQSREAALDRALAEYMADHAAAARLRGRYSCECAHCTQARAAREMCAEDERDALRQSLLDAQARHAGCVEQLRESGKACTCPNMSAKTCPFCVITALRAEVAELREALAEEIAADENKDGNVRPQWKRRARELSRAVLEKTKP
jgi:aminopeptidase N